MSKLPDHVTRVLLKSQELPALLVAHVLPVPHAKVAMLVTVPLQERDNKPNKVERVEHPAAVLKGDPTGEGDHLKLVVKVVPLPPGSPGNPENPGKEVPLDQRVVLHVPPERDVPHVLPEQIDQRVPHVLPELHPPILYLLPISPTP